MVLLIDGGDGVIVDLWGRPVRLPYERWLHITNPNGRHPYMAYLRAELELTLQDPEVVRKSRDYPDTVRIYFRWFADTIVGSKWVTVVVRFFDGGDAFVLTAYGENRLLPGEEIWRKGQG